MDAPNPTEPLTHEQKVEQTLEQIAAYLHRQEVRDRTRLAWGTVRALFGIIPLVLFLYGAWYFSVHGTEMIQQMTEQTMRNMLGGGSASSKASSKASSSQSFLEQIQNYMR